MPLGKRLSSLESRGGRAEFAGIRLPDLGVTTCESAFWCRALDPFNSTVRRDSRAVVGRRSWLAPVRQPPFASSPGGVRGGRRGAGRPPAPPRDGPPLFAGCRGGWGGGGGVGPGGGPGGRGPDARGGT